MDNGESVDCNPYPKDSQLPKAGNEHVLMVHALVLVRTQKDGTVLGDISQDDIEKLLHDVNLMLRHTNVKLVLETYRVSSND